tara:strand:+ start:1446 stop:1928 length:483 start_codon:yes stop_codon:yes gene_type:complete
METYKVHQIKIPKEIRNLVNKVGHIEAGKKYPEYEASQDAYRGFEKWDDAKFKYYTQVVQVKVDGGLVEGDKPFKIQDLEDVFRVLNHGFYDEDKETDIVYENHVFDYGMKTYKDKEGNTKEYADFHSLSVGDIVEDPNGDYFLVDDFGFKQILKNKEVA